MSAEAELARRQHGVISRTQLVALGMSRHQIEHRVQTERLIAARPGVYTFAGTPRSDRQALWEAVLWAGRDATVSHRAAAVVWRFESIACANPELWTPRRLRASDVIVHRGVVPARDRGLREGLPITSVTRTLSDLAAVIEEEVLEGAIEEARRRHLISDDRMRRDFGRMSARGRPGSQALGRLTREFEGSAPTESRLEVRVLRILRNAGIATPVRQFEVILGRRRYRIDLAWPDLKVGIECEGYSVHGRRRAYVPDRVRLAAVVGAGWRIVPVTWEQTKAPEELAAVVNSALREAAS